MSEEFRKELEKLIEKLRSDIEALSKRVEELSNREEYYRAYRVWIEGITNILKKARDSLVKLESQVKELKISETEVRASLEYFEKELRELLIKINEETSRLRIRKFLPRISLPEKIVRSIAVSVSQSVEDIVESINEMIESMQKSFKYIPDRVSQVVSVRVREKDLEVIDQLVDAGIFKSRSDAITYFARRGVEASREWIDKALEQAKKIRELQESIRRELEEDESS
ncbi:MAG: hypothetical protein RMI56_01295 [Sulfolobales archaeon]|nr:hypothetical protein [Sulfolobales archaeon]MDW8082414.1 hypothetical protein [Sulfolobales archaeon]